MGSKRNKWVLNGEGQEDNVAEAMVSPEKYISSIHILSFPLKSSEFYTQSSISTSLLLFPKSCSNINSPGSFLVSQMQDPRWSPPHLRNMAQIDLRWELLYPVSSLRRLLGCQDKDYRPLKGMWNVGQKTLKLSPVGHSKRGASYRIC